ncbi:thiamine diphosphokinase [Sulfitobacter sp. M57]|nr:MULTISPECIES: thiamine diphosphokinase [unclassified Sulfitobacter]MDF3414238.1 thiamine diphosphokinase [Sulfitobacter sp. KE5]MDF3420480.1 thiamine diphosphokinase [Sulfitobacter sp. KE43]MDF3432784.1 thiamine diphosphokinase [Sulfitobacter sp. KE42]MDF3458424.1 thiamine diphosphokinase [Sulfitobacter sp. S74]MDF3462324.1 thiamine diphosphokinase [Sulfitobacter sp. Ks18]
MFDPIVSSPDLVTLVGGGEATPQDLAEALTLAPVCVAVDGGAALALRCDVAPAAVIGDFDSVSDRDLAGVPAHRQHRIAEQDSTDFEKALSRVATPVVLGVGFLGGRVDHQLAAFHTLAARCERPCVLLGREEVVCLAPPAISLPTQVGDVVSLFPLAAVAGQSTGLEWPIQGLAFDPLTQIGTSNRATGPVTLQMQTAAMILILPRRLMPELLSALSQTATARWPARAE